MYVGPYPRAFGIHIIAHVLWRDIHGKDAILAKTRKTGGAVGNGNQARHPKAGPRR